MDQRYVAVMSLDVDKLPCCPGCYFFKDKDGRILYIGKASNLKKRVSSYFNRPAESGKTAELIKRIHDIDVIIVDRETEALLLEARLIRQHRPRYNIDLKDGERYAYILVTDEPFPRIMTARGRRRKGRWFGPFVDGTHRRALIRSVNLLTKMRVCQTLPRRACIQYHIGNCTAPCIGKVSRNEYAHQVGAAQQWLEGKTDVVISQLMGEMARASQELKFERAKELRDHLAVLSRKAERQKIESPMSKDQDVVVKVQSGRDSLIQIFHVRKGVLLGKKEFRLSADVNWTEFFMQVYTANPVPREIVVEESPSEKALLEAALSKVRQAPVSFVVPSRGKLKELLEMVRKNALIQAGQGDIGLRDLQDVLPLPKYPKIIECFDISHLSGKQMVGSMVQLVEAKSKKSQYRCFKIKTVKGIDDFKAMNEVVFRRYRRLKEESKPFPELVVIDGGQGQLRAAKKALEEVGVPIPVIGLAKKLEEIYIPDKDPPLHLNPNRPALLVLRRARDEAHRFALRYHTVLREKGLSNRESNRGE